MQDVGYYYINDLQLVGKIENRISYIYCKKNGWQVDKEHLLMERLIGYDGYEIGVMSELEKIDSISEEKAFALINTM